jgi:hypothetical protein
MLEEKKVLDIGLGNYFFFVINDTKSIGTKSKNKKSKISPTKKLLPIAETINKRKRQLMGWEKMFANHTS